MEDQLPGVILGHLVTFEASARHSCGFGTSASDLNAALFC